MFSHASEASMKEQSKPPEGRPPSAPREGKRPYSKPIITEYGSVSRLTQGSRTNQADGGSGGFRGWSQTP